MSYNLDTDKFIKKLFIEGNSPITNELNMYNILSKYDIIYFNIHFNQKIDNLPSNIKAIRFTNYNNIYYYINSNNTNYNESFRFNQPINNLPNLEFLELSGTFEQSLNYLPFSLKYLILNIYNYTNVCLNFLPPNLEILILKTNEYSFNNLPIGLQELYLIGRRTDIMNNFPINLKLLFINGNTNQLDDYLILPPNLEVFIFNDCEFLQLNINIIKQKLKNKEFPITLKEMHFPIWFCKYNTELINLSSYIYNGNLIIKYKQIDDNIIKTIIDKY